MSGEVQVAIQNSGSQSTKHKTGNEKLKSYNDLKNPKTAYIFAKNQKLNGDNGIDLKP